MKLKKNNEVITICDICLKEKQLEFTTINSGVKGCRNCRRIRNKFNPVHIIKWHITLAKYEKEGYEPIGSEPIGY